MPLHPAEEATIRAFVLPGKRQRVLFLLADGKRRGHGVDWLNHFAAWDPRWASPIGSPTQAAIVSRLRAAGAGEICHLISDDRGLDGRDLPLANAVEAAVNFAFSSLLCCVPGQLAAYFDESPRQVVLLERPEGKPLAGTTGADG